MMTAGQAPGLEAGIPLHHRLPLEEPAGAYRQERFPASASLVRKHGSERLQLRVRGAAGVPT